MKRFEARGKFLISGEYAVLDGATALAVPLNFGQVLTVEEYPDTHALWISNDENGRPWFHALIHPGTGLIVEHDNHEVAKTLEPLLRSIPDPLRRAAFKGKKLSFQVDFNRDYGLGSSSTMLALLASWLKLNPYKLLEHHLGGSGYDLACATAESPILFQRNTETGIQVRPVAIPKTFWEQVSFIYSGKKQNSREGIIAYKSKPHNKELIAELTAISEKITKSPDIHSWSKLLNQHDELLSAHLGLNRLKETFPDCPFFMKPMGAWGGDFFMALGPQNEVAEFFSKKGFSPVWKADQVVYSPKGTGSKQA
jgi:mevalonate kinase